MYLERPKTLIEKASAFTCPIMYIMYFLWEEFERKIEDAHEVQNDEVKYPEKGGSREGNFFPLIHNHLNPQRNSLKKVLEKHTSKVSNNLAKINLWIYLSHCVHNFFFYEKKLQDQLKMELKFEMPVQNYPKKKEVQMLPWKEL